MKTLRHYFISDDLDELEAFEERLEAAGISDTQMHVLTLDDEGVATHGHLHAVQSIMRRDIVHSAEVGALLGLILALAILLLASMLELPDVTLGWFPWVFVSIIAFGFCTWEGGLFGMHTMNHRFRQFEQTVANHKHVMFVDLNPDQEQPLRMALTRHPRLQLAGTAPGTPDWIMRFRRRLVSFIDRNLLSQAQI